MTEDQADRNLVVPPEALVVIGQLHLEIHMLRVMVADRDRALYELRAKDPGSIEEITEV